MKDKETEWLMGLNPFDKVKGHTKIELTDVKTGKKQVIEKDNAFQAGVLAQYMRSMGAYNNNPYANSTWAGQPIWRNLCGGIFCFRDTIDLTDGEVEYMPAGNEMVANGAYMVNNAGTPIELGSYNEVESSTSGNDSVTFVYDWLTSQGNGTISCVCLTTEIGGYIGYGNKSGTRASSKSFNSNQSSGSFYTRQVTYDNAVWTFSVNNTDKLVTVTRKPFQISKGSIFDNIAEDSFTLSYTGSIFGSYQLTIYIGHGKVALICLAGSGTHGGIGNGTTFSPLIIVDLVNRTASLKTITNNTGVTLTNRRYQGIGVVGVDEQYIYFNGFDSPYHVYAIDYTDGLSTFKDLEISGTTNQQNHCWCGEITPELFNVFGRIWDKTNDTIYPINCTQLFTQYNDDIDAIVCNYIESGNSTQWTRYTICKNPLILATVNNLETPVTKTAAQTMKITYTLTKASE